MKFDVYCDESRPEALATKKIDSNENLVIGSLWLPSEIRAELKEAIHSLRNTYKVGGEFKWQKISPSRKDFYEALLDVFFSYGDSLRFRCIVVNKTNVDLLKYHDGDQELGFYKFYYQMLHHWILDFNEYSIFCDYKRNRNTSRLSVLGEYLQRSNISSYILNVQAINSDESVLIQLVDVLTGAASAKFNETLRGGGVKEKLVTLLEERLGRELAHTLRSEQKFNVFVIKPQGGW